jgi:hypothetical protein
VVIWWRVLEEMVIDGAIKADEEAKGMESLKEQQHGYTVMIKASHNTCGVRT